MKSFHIILLHTFNFVYACLSVNLHIKYMFKKYFILSKVLTFRLYNIMNTILLTLYSSILDQREAALVSWSLSVNSLRQGVRVYINTLHVSVQ